MPSESVGSGREDSKDGEQILGEFLRGAEISLVENQEFATVLLEDLLDESGSEPGESVSAGNHKRELIALVNSFQYGGKSFAPVVES